MKPNKKITINHIIAILFLLFITYFSITNLSMVRKSAQNIIQNHGKNITSEISSLTKTYDEKFYLKNSFIEINGLVHNLLGKRTMNNVIKLNNGYLETLTTSGGTMKKQSKRIIDLYEILQTKNLPMLYVQAPSKISKFDNKLPVGLIDKSNENADNFLNEIRTSDIPILDIREEIQNDGLNQYSLFFKTDHHWTTEGAFFAYTKIMEKLTDFGFIIDPDKLDIDNYNQEHFREHFLGSSGRRTSSNYAGLDDFSLIYPKYKTEMSVTIPSKDIYRYGSFEDAIFNYSRMENINTKNNYSISAYSTYIGGDYPLVIHENQEAENKKTILLIKDSFALPLQSFLSLSVSNLHVIDLRHYTDNTLLEYIDDVKPDLVIFQYNAKILKNDMLFQFGIEQYNNSH